MFILALPSLMASVALNRALRAALLFACSSKATLVSSFFGGLRALGESAVWVATALLASRVRQVYNHSFAIILPQRHLLSFHRCHDYADLPYVLLQQRQSSLAGRIHLDDDPAQQALYRTATGVSFYCKHSRGRYTLPWLSEETLPEWEAFPPMLAIALRHVSTRRTSWHCPYLDFLSWAVGKVARIGVGGSRHDGCWIDLCLSLGLEFSW